RAADRADRGHRSTDVADAHRAARPRASELVLPPDVARARLEREAARPRGCRSSLGAGAQRRAVEALAVPHRCEEAVAEDPRPAAGHCNGVQAIGQGVDARLLERDGDEPSRVLRDAPDVERLALYAAVAECLPP